MTFLCLSCRTPGHKTANCPTAPPPPPPATKVNGIMAMDWVPLHWEAPPVLVPPASAGSDLCRRCRGLRILDLLQSDEVQSEGDYVRTAARAAGSDLIMTAQGASNPRLEAIFHNDRLCRSLGRFADIELVDTCPLCRLLFALFPTAVDPGQRPHPDAVFDLRPQRMYDVADVAKAGHLASMPADAARCYSVAVSIVAREERSRQAIELLATGALSPPRPAFALTSDTKGLPARVCGPRADPGLLAGWLRRCDREHGAFCGPLWTNELLTTKMIDVQTRQLVPCPRRARYLALSYVWGAGMKPNTVADLHNGTLAATLEDAIAVARDLGVPYLWIDALCIDQTLTAAQKLPQLTIMDRIYEGAYATLFAFWGDSATAGLRGISTNGGPALRPPQPQAVVDGHALAAVYPDLFVERGEFASCTLRTRAWTMQEELLSRRSLFFGRDQVHFHCRLTNTEETVDEIADPLLVCDSTTAAPAALTSDAMQFWDLQRQASSSSGTAADPRHVRRMAAEHFSQMVSDYTARQMTYDADALNACRGLLSAIQRIFAMPGGFVWGLPLADLPLSLLWMHDGNSLPSAGSSAPRRRAPLLPSWSYVAWDAPAHYATSLLAPADEDATERALQRSRAITKDATVRLVSVHGPDDRVLRLAGYTVTLAVRTDPFSEAFVPGTTGGNSIGMLLQNNETHPTSLPDGVHVFLVVQRVRRVMQAATATTPAREHHRLHLLLLDASRRQRLTTVQWTVDAAFMETAQYQKMLEWQDALELE